MSEPLITRNFALLLVSLTCIVVLAPFMDRNDWMGWVAFFVVMAAVGWIVGSQLFYLAYVLREWWAGRDLD